MLLNKLLQQRAYSVKLAKKIGIPKSALFYFLVNRFDSLEFIGRDCINGTEFNIDDFNGLVNNNIIVKEGDKYFINTNAVDIILRESVEIYETHPPFTNHRFVLLCNKWMEILRDKKRTKSKKEIYQLFTGRSLDESINALKLSITNRYISLFFNDTDKEHTQGDGGKKSIGHHGGGKNSDQNFSYKDSKKRLEGIAE